MTHISIIIVNYNTPEDTTECLQSLLDLQLAKITLSVVVVDNGSQTPYALPKKFKKASKSANPTFEVVRSESNLGFTGGNNLGIHYAIEKYNSEYVLLLNSDTTVDSGLIKNLLAFAEDHPRFGIISPKIYFSKGAEYHETYDKKFLGSILWYAGGSIDWQHLVAFHRGVDEVDREHFDSVIESEFATGCGMLIRREVLEKVGLFDKRFFLYLEDVDLCVRAKSLGYAIGFCPSAKMWHKNAGSSDGVGNATQTYYQTRNRLLFTFKHGSLDAKIQAIRIAFLQLFSGSSHARLGVFHAATARFGKQQII